MAVGVGLEAAVLTINDRCTAVLKVDTFSEMPVVVPFRPQKLLFH